MGHCRYLFNPSEIYQRTKPGQGVETTCGALTFPAVDEPEVVPVPMRQPGQAEVTYSYHETGRKLPRAAADPYCPAHGGSPEPPPPPVTMADLQAAHEAYLALADRFKGEQGQPAAVVGVPMPALPAAESPAAVSAEQLAEAKRQLAELAARAQQEVTSDEQPAQ